MLGQATAATSWLPAAGIRTVRDRYLECSYDGTRVPLFPSYVGTEVAKTTLAIRDQTRQQERRDQDDKDKKCLRDFFVTDPRIDKKRIEETKGGLLKGSYSWILQHEHYKQFRDDQQNRLLWIKGDPGKGKTMLLCGIIDHLKKTPAERRLLSYFFCQATDERINTATAVLRGLIFMLLNQDPSLMPHIRKGYDTTGKALVEGVNAWQSLMEIFINILEDTKLQGVCLVVDALDECVEGLPQLLDLIVQTSRLNHAKWLVSSRHWIDIEKKLGTVAHRLSLELNAKSVSTAVETYIKFKVSELTQLKGYQKGTADEVRWYLSKNADDTFLWVALVCDELRKVPPRHTQNALKSFPPGLDSLYKRMMEYVSTSHDSEACYEILALASTVYRPLSVDELQCLTQSIESLSQDEALEVIASCGSFLTLRDSIVFFIHQSAKDFLLATALHDIFSSGAQRQHEKIFSRSVAAMSRLLRRDICQRIHFASPNDEQDASRPTSEPLAVLAYSCVYWIDHFVDSSSHANMNISATYHNEAIDFLKTTCLYWLESLGWLRGVSHILLSLDSLANLQKELFPNSSSTIFISEVLNFARSNRWVIENYPLQTYASALIFAPDQSTFLKCFHAEKPLWIREIYRNSQEWPQTLEGHNDTVNKLVFLNDIRTLVSASKDKTVRLWDVFTGECNRVFTHEYEVYDVTSWQDGRWLATACKDHVIRIWSILSNEWVRDLRGHKGPVKSLAVFPNGRQMVSGSTDKTVKVWIVDTGEVLRTLPHRSAVRQVVISPCGDFIVSATLEKCIRIWSVKEQYSLREVKIDSECNALAFSLEASSFASALQNGTIRIMKSTTGECSHVIQSSGSCLTFLPPNMLAFGSTDKTIHIWSAIDGTEQGIGFGHQHAITTLAFSSDGKRLASASRDNVIRLSTKLDQPRKGPEHHKGPVHQVRFSPNREWLAATSADATVRLWCVSTWTLHHTLEGHKADVYSATFSGDSQRLITVSKDTTARVWDVATGLCEHELEGHESDVLAVAFSHDGKRVATGSHDETVRIWDVEIGDCDFTLEGHRGYIHDVAFSQDDKYIISASKDHTVRIWNAITGEFLKEFQAEDNLHKLLHFDARSAPFQTSNGYLATISQATFPATQEITRMDQLPLQDVSRIHTQLDPQLSIRDNWVWNGEQPWLWVPPDDRPHCWHSHDNLMAFGHDSGDVTFIHFNFQKQQSS